MDLTCDERPSDSPFVERIWCSQSEEGGSFISLAESRWEMVVTRHEGRTALTVRGPETRATPAYGPANAEYFGIQFKAGTFMPNFPAKMVMDRHELELPEATSKSFWLHGSAWQFPDFENADTFVNRLVRDGLLVFDPVVSAVLQEKPVKMSLRTAQRRVLQATGLTASAVFQIKRARYATTLLQQGVSILDTVDLAGYFDQPHLTRSIKHLIGQTPAQIVSSRNREPLSFLYKTDALLLAYDSNVRSAAKGAQYAENNRQ
jgi:AraC-like DNA-binding protein